MSPYNTAGAYYNDKPLTHCKYCGHKLEQSCEFDTCISCRLEILETQGISEFDFMEEKK